MTRWQIIRVLSIVAYRVFVKRDYLGLLRDLLPKEDPHAEPMKHHPSAMGFVPELRKMVRGGGAHLLVVLILAGVAMAAGQITVTGYPPVPVTIKGGVGIDIVGKEIRATGVAVPISIQPWSNISSASRGNLAPYSVATAFTNFTTVDRATVTQVNAGLALKSPVFANYTTLVRFGAGPTYNGLPIASGGVAGVQTFNARSGNVLPSSGDYSIGQIAGAATVATTGSYNDLSNKPTLSTVAATGSYNDLLNKPTLATVATTGSYNDLLNKPAGYTLPTATTTVLGGVKVDGTTVVIDGAGVISSTVTAGVSTVDGASGAVDLSGTYANKTTFQNYTTIDRVAKSELSSATDSTSVTTAANSAAVKAAYDLAAGKQSPATTLAGYGITDAATAAQGAKADTALQPSGSNGDTRIGIAPRLIRPDWKVVSGTTPGYTATSNIATMPNGQLIVAWKEGATEFADGGNLMVAKGATWDTIGTPVSVKTTAIVGASVANPAFIRDGNRTYLFYNLYYQNANHLLDEADIYFMYSDDADCATWTDGTNLPINTAIAESFVHSNGIKLSNGSLMIGSMSYPEAKSFFVKCSSSCSNGANWAVKGPITLASSVPVEPTVMEYAPGQLLAYMRNDGGGYFGGATNNYVIKSESPDYGESWGTASFTSLAAYHSPQMLLKTSTGGSVLLLDKGNNRYMYRMMGNGTSEDTQWSDRLLIDYAPDSYSEANSCTRYVSATQQGDYLVYSWSYGQACTSTRKEIRVWGEPAPYSVNLADMQKRVTGGCTAGSSIRVINADGTVTCETDDLGAAGTIGGSTGGSDNMLIRSDGTGGSTVQASGITVTDDNFIGQGTTSPAAPFTLDTSISSSLPVGFGSVRIQGTANKERLEIRSLVASIVKFLRFNGTQSSPTPVVSGDFLGGINGGGYTGESTNTFETGFSTGSAAAIGFWAEENFTSAAMGGRIVFNTSAVGSKANPERMRITAAGNVGIGTTSPNHKLSVAGGISGQMAAVNKSVDATLTAEEVSNTILSNFGATGLVTATLPAAAAGYSFIATVSAAQELRLDPNASDTIYLNDEALTSEDGEYISLGSTIGAQVACYTAITGTGPAYDWFCRDLRGMATEQD